MPDNSFTSEPMFVLTAILMTGSLLGTVQVAGFRLGSLGVLLASLVFGYFGAGVPDGVAELGLLLFVFAVGLQAGPRFFRMFLRSGGRLLVLGGVPVFVAMIATLLSAYLLDLGSDMAAGLFAGSLTNTPVLAATLDVLGPASSAAAKASASFGVVFPLAMALVLLVVRITSSLLRVDLGAEDERWQSDRASDTPGIITKHLRITNYNCHGQLVRNISSRSQAKISFSGILRDVKSFLP